MFYKKQICGQFLGVSMGGDYYIIHEYCILAATLDGKNEWSPNTKVYQLPNGEPVIRLSHDTYKIVSTGEKLTLETC